MRPEHGQNLSHWGTTLESASMPHRPIVSPPLQLSLFDEVSSPPSPAPEGAPAPSLTALEPKPSSVPEFQAIAPSPVLPFSHPQAQRNIVLAGHRVAYALRRARRRSIGFVVSAEGLSVSAPRWVGQAEIESALREKSTWILRKLQEMRERERRLDAARVDWRDGTTLPFLGETVIVVLDSRTTGAVLQAAPHTLPGMPRLTLHLGLPHTAAPAQIRDTVQSWLQHQAKHIFEERCALLSPRLGVRMKRLSLSSATTRWGSASADGSIRLNWRLVHFAMPVVDYVVAHELAHLREMNHSPAFWDVVRSAVPDFEQARGSLRHEVLPVFD